jgi:hypothetical protein
MKMYTYLCTRTYSYTKISIACHLYVSVENIPNFFIYSLEYTEKGTICTFVQYIHKLDIHGIFRDILYKVIYVYGINIIMQNTLSVNENSEKRLVPPFDYRCIVLLKEREG